VIARPVVFVHGNGDSAALWHTTIWRFESNGVPRGRLFAIDFSFPQAREDDTLPMACRSGTDDQLRELSAFVARVLRETGAGRIALVASSRGANAVRHFVRNGGGDALVSEVVLCGGVNHGVYVSATFNPRSEFNGSGPFMRTLNAPYPDGSEVTPGVRWLTLRSEGLDKYAQPYGTWVGQPEMATGITSDGPALRGAHNVAIADADHREVAFGPRSFDEMYRFLAGVAPQRLDIVPEVGIVLDGVVSGFCNDSPSNQPLSGAVVSVHEVAAGSGIRLRTPIDRKAIGSDGGWGPLSTHASACLEFVIEAEGCPITHIYRSPFARSSTFVHLRPALPGSLPAAGRAGISQISISRPRGYFGVGRDIFEIDGAAPPGVSPGVPAVSIAAMRVAARLRRTVQTRFNDEAIAVVNWPAAENRVVIAEFHT
jgi:pimeloyl-ACP methyl ester carboxylesterase